MTLKEDLYDLQCFWLNSFVSQVAQDDKTGKIVIELHYQIFINPAVNIAKTKQSIHLTVWYFIKDKLLKIVYYLSKMYQICESILINPICFLDSGQPCYKSWCLAAILCYLLE